MHVGNSTQWQIGKHSSTVLFSLPFTVLCNWNRFGRFNYSIRNLFWLILNVCFITLDCNSFSHFFLFPFLSFVAFLICTDLGLVPKQTVERAANETIDEYGSRPILRWCSENAWISNELVTGRPRRGGVPVLWPWRKIRIWLRWPTIPFAWRCCVRISGSWSDRTNAIQCIRWVSHASFIEPPHKRTHCESIEKFGKFHLAFALQQ